MQLLKKHPTFSACLIAGLLVSGTAAEASVSVTLTFSNIAGANGAALSPILAAFHDGSYNPFSTGSAASSAIQSIAEAGNGQGLAANLAAANLGGMSTTVAATTNGFGPGIYLPGATGSVTLNLDPVKDRYLSYFSMVVPSNDRFIGNASSTEIQLFDSTGHFTGGTYVENGNTVWDAGTEADGLFGAAFLVGSNGADHLAQNGVVTANSDFSIYGGLATPAGYTFSNLPTASSPLLKITAVSSVPVPAAVWLFGSALPFLGFMRRRHSINTL